MGALKISRNEALVIGIKLLASCLFASFYFRDYFAPFVEYASGHLFTNPYNYFYETGNLKAFPYGMVMLWLLLAGKLITLPLALVFGNSIYFTMLGFGLTTVFFDWIIYKVLVQWFPAQKHKVFVLYFCSPIVFYITFFHRQLDIIPIGILFGSLYALNKRNALLSAVLLGLAINAKANVLIVLPFILFFLFRRKEYKLCVLYALVVSGVYALLVVPYLPGGGFQQLVFRASEQSWLFDFGIPFGNKGLILLLGPAFLFLLLLNYFSYGRISRDAMMMYIGLAFMILVTFVSPMPGWYMWSYPFIIYAYLKYTDFPRLPLLVLHAAYFFYFIFYSNTTFFDSFAVISSSIPSYSWSSLSGFTPDALTDSILFIPLAGIMFYLMVVMFLLGIRNNRLANFRKRSYLIGIGGDSGTGKHTLAELFKQLFTEKNVMQINGDADHKWERGHEKWSVFTHLNPKANNLYVQFDQAHMLKQGRSIQRIEYDHDTGKFTQPKPVSPDTYVLFVGLHPYYIPQMRKLFDFKIYMDTAEDLRLKWKMERDQARRGYSEEKIKEQIQKRLPDAEKYIKPQAQFADLIIKYLAEDEQKRLTVEYTLSTQWNLETIFEYLEQQNEKSFTIDHHYDEAFEKQKVVFAGDISKTCFETFVQEHIEEFEEIISPGFRFDDGFNGFTQFLALNIILQQSKSNYNPAV